MSLLANLTTDESIAGEKDTIGGFGPIESGMYPSKIELAYLTEADSGAVGLVLHAKTDSGSLLRQTVYMTSGKAKGGKNYYEKDGEKFYLPGFLTANSIALLTVGKQISELQPEEKVTNVYSKVAKAEVPTKVQMLTELLGQPVLLGVIKQTVDKTVKNDAGAYVPTGETREENEIDKVFRARDRMTTAEILAGAEEASFADRWAETNTGKTRNKASKGAKAGVAGAPKGAAAAAAPKKSLFA